MMVIALFSLAYLIKGGQFPIRSGKAISTGLVFAISCNYHEVFQSLIVSAAWLLAVAPSMGEEAGAIGRIGHWWGKYLERGFDRRYGVLKGVQRGAWMGAVFTVAGATTLSIPLMSVGFPLAHFLGQEAHWRIHGRDDWKYAEAIVGALLGLCFLTIGE